MTEVSFRVAESRPWFRVIGKHCAILFRRMLDEWDQRRAIDQLQSFDDRMLRDIGLTRGTIRAAVRGQTDRL